MNNSHLVEKVSAELPKVLWFLSLKQVELAQLTNTDEARWSRYFNGAHIGEKALNQFAKALGMKPYALLLAVHLRREGGKLTDHVSTQQKVLNLV